MKNFVLKTTSQKNCFLLQETDYLLNSNLSLTHSNNISISSIPRSLSKLGSLSYSRSLRRSFSRAKLLSFFNPDLNHFLTFTYSQNITDIDIVLKDIKYFIRLQNKFNKQQYKQQTNNNKTNNKQKTNKKNKKN